MYVCRVWIHFRKTRQVSGGKRLPSYAHVTGNMQYKSRYPAEDVGLMGIVAAGEEFRSQRLRMSEAEWKILKECRTWLQSRNIWMKVYQTNLEQLQQLYSRMGQFVGSASEWLSPYTNSDDVREGWQQTLTRELGHRDSGLVMADLSEYKGPYAQMTAPCEKVGMAIARKPAENRSNIEEQVHHWICLHRRTCWTSFLT